VVKDCLGCQVALECVTILHGRDLGFELLAQVGQALLFGCAPGVFVRLGEGSLLFHSHWCALSE
jgi:hypothetical protein